MYIVGELCHSFGMSWESGASRKEAWPCNLDTHQQHYLKHNSGIFASVMPDPTSMHCNLHSVSLLPLGYEAVGELVM